MKAIIQYITLLILFLLYACSDNEPKGKEDGDHSPAHWSDMINHPGTYTALAGYDSTGKQFYYLTNQRNNSYLDLYHVDVSTSKERLIFQNDSGFVLQESDHIKAVSPQGTNVALTKYLSNTHSELYLYNTAEHKYRKLEILSDSSTTLTALRFTHDNQLYYLSDYQSDFPTLYRYNTDTNISSKIYQTNGLIEEVLYLNENNIAILVNRLSRSEIILLDLSKSIEKTLFKDQGYIEPSTLQFEKGSNELKFYYSTPVSPHQLVTVNLVTRHKNIEDSIESNLNFKPVSFQSETFKIHGFLLWPNINQNKKIPLNIFIHGGPEIQQPTAYVDFLTDIAKSGIAVFVPNIRGSSGYGKKFFHADDRQHHLTAPIDIKNGKDFLLKNYKFLDSSHVFLHGQSYGGYALYHALITYPGDFSGGIVINGVVDYHAALTSMPDYFKPIEVMKYTEFGYPSLDSVALTEAAIPKKLNLLQTKLLIFQGTEDMLVPYESVKSLVKKLNSKNAKFIPLENTGHDINNPEIGSMITQESIKFIKE